MECRLRGEEAVMAESESMPEREEEVPETRGYAGQGPGCDACGSTMQPMGHCKYLCRRCGFLRTCIDTV